MKKINKNERPNKHHINKIASNTNLNEKQINIWFILKQRLNKRKFISVKSTKKNLSKNNCLITESNQIDFTITKALLDEYDKNKYPDKKSRDIE